MHVFFENVGPFAWQPQISDCCFRKSNLVSTWKIWYLREPKLVPVPSDGSYFISFCSHKSKPKFMKKLIKLLVRFPLAQPVLAQNVRQ